MTASAHSARATHARPNGWWGMAIFIATEATLFGTLFGTYYYLRFLNPHWPPPGVPLPDVLVPLVLAFVLASTSFPMHLASRFGGAGRVGAARAALLAALVVQAGCFAMQIQLFHDDVTKFAPGKSAYGSITITILGAHLAHLAVGLLLSLWMILRLARGLTRYRLVGLQATTIYWHFVNVLALLVVGVELSARV
jgi:heme/copper-type cytochrome/quinol oxidase subunit 3